VHEAEAAGDDHVAWFMLDGVDDVASRPSTKVRATSGARARQTGLSPSRAKGDLGAAMRVVSVPFMRRLWQHSSPGSTLPGVAAAESQIWAMKKTCRDDSRHCLTAGLLFRRTQEVEEGAAETNCRACRSSRTQPHRGREQYPRYPAVQPSNRR
jgi:hypothetical protein